MVTEGVAEMAVEMAGIGVEHLAHEYLGRRHCWLAGEGRDHMPGERVVGLERKHLAIRGQRRDIVAKVLVGIGQIESGQNERGIT